MNDDSSFLDIADHLPINHGDMVLIGSDVFLLAANCRRSAKRFDGNLLIDSLIQKVGNTGTLLFPTFNWGFCRGETFDIKQTKSETGSLSQLALARQDFQRTQHPIYSFSVTGKLTDKLVSLDNKSAFGSDSPFGLLTKHHAKMLIIGIEYNHSLTYVHHVEELTGVPYRSIKNFQAPYIDKTGDKNIKEYSMYVRRLEAGIINNLNPIGQILEDKKIANIQYFFNIKFVTLDLTKSFQIIKNDIENNHSKNLVNFLDA
ncbi:MAG: hypothetical protein HON94_11455 [Methylococcales bacterium]|jgi:aminoglycoside 3-N-acetyltransferase|nr:hypothetical protein [Methylococcales bacterium]MBT7408337.1 hypothetical protein [Methylococcales bacterium]